MSEIEVDLNTMTDSLNTEEVPSLSDFAEEVGGAWPKGWYAATIIEGYTTRKGTEFRTEDNPSKNGDSRNLRVCFKVTNAKGEERTLQQSYNYRTSDFSLERLAYIKEARQEYKGVKGKWPDSDAQRSSLAIAKLGGLEKSVGFRLKRNEAGALIAAIFVNQPIDVYLTVDDEGYNEVGHVAKSGERTKKKSS